MASGPERKKGRKRKKASMADEEDELWESSSEEMPPHDDGDEVQRIRALSQNVTALNDERLSNIMREAVQCKANVLLLQETRHPPAVLGGRRGHSTKLGGRLLGLRRHRLMLKAREGREAR